MAKNLLKPCPWCGAEMHVEKCRPVFYGEADRITIGGRHDVSCPLDAAVLPVWEADELEDLVECWNTRGGYPCVKS